MTNLELKRGRIRIVAIILVTVAILFSIKLFIDNSHRRLAQSKPVVAHAEAVETPKPVVVVPEPEPTPVVEPIQPEQRPILDNDAKAFIYQHESGNCPTKWQGERGACPAFHGVPDDPNIGYGLCQSTPASKMAVMGAGWETSWDLQDQWCTMHAQGYGGWQNSYYHWIAYGNW